jgi:glyoxylase-like metal-dependent hydrolase (beta-lactamase superfamily II)
LKTVNLYLLKGKGEVALVDTALATRTAQGSLELYLAELGLCFQNVKTVLLTHHHPDHYGLAGFFEGLGARVYLHAEELGRGHRFWLTPEAFEEASWRLFLDHGTPEEALLGIHGQDPRKGPPAQGAPGPRGRGGLGGGGEEA